MAASESQFSISSSSRSPSPAARRLSLLAVGAFTGRLERGSGRGRGRGRTAAAVPDDRRAGHRHDRLAVGADHHGGRHGLGVGPGIGRFEVDDVAQEHLSLVELVAPDDDGLEGERALAQPRDHGLAAGLDALGDGDLALAGQEFHRAHLAQIHAHRIVGALGRLLGLGFGRHLLLDLDQFARSLSAPPRAPRAAPLLLGLASSVSTTLTPISLNIARMSSICSELTSSERSELIWSWVT